MLLPLLTLSSLLKHFRKLLISLWLFGLLSCKDFKNWQSRYTNEIKIKFEKEKDKWVPKLPKNLQSDKISNWLNNNDIVAFLESDNNKVFEIKNDTSLSIALDPNADSVSFILDSKQNIFFQKVTICYKRKSSLISPEAGGLQIQYIINSIQLHTATDSNPIVKQFSIETAVPLKEDEKENKVHVTLYY